ncbi:ATP-binding protein [Actinomadura sp. LOL_016]|uniref:ATP-binding protein n=1 Tax=unclassified Actinomadura TaxID=2626254 RepID=UPI003A80594D
MNEELDGFLSELVEEWPQRFRHRRLLVALGESAGPQELAHALLEGVAAGQDEYGVFDGLVAEGRFELAETMLADCVALDEAVVGELTQRLDTVRARRRTRLLRRLEELDERAKLAGAAFTADRDLLVEYCQTSWPDAATELDRLELDLEDRIGERRAAVLERIGALDGTDEKWRAAGRSLADKGLILAAEALLDRPDDRSGGPATVPSLPDWLWKEEPDEVLRWHLDPATRRPSSFSLWRVRQDSVEHRLLDAYDSLRKVDSARLAADFASALDAFLGAEPGPKTAHPVEGGHLTSLSGAFADPETAGFRPIGGVDLFVAAPETRTVPRLPGLAPFLAVGHGLVPRGYADRTDAAVLDPRSLLRLINVPTRRSVALLRIAGGQWPLSAFTHALEAGGETVDWRTLSWIVDLAGLGDLTTMAALEFESGLDPALVRLLLDFLRQDSDRRPRVGGLPRWGDDPRMTARVRAAVLSAVAGSPAAEAVFWAALAAAMPGERVGVPDLIRESALSSERAGGVDEATVRAGIGELAALTLADVTGPDALVLRRCGVLVTLAGRAGEQLPAALERLSTATVVEEAGAETAPGPWDLHRHSLAPGRAAYDAAPGPEAARALAAQTADLTSADVPLGGQSDLVEVLARLRPDFTAAHPRVELVVDSPPAAPVPVRPELLETLLYELLSNAAEAVGASGGSVRVQADMTDGDLVVDVQDSGPGIAEAIGGHRVFRRGTSTRGDGRGDGLHRARTLAQRVDGDLLLSARQAVHPVLKGAHFQLVLPGG